MYRNFYSELSVIIIKKLWSALCECIKNDDYDIHFKNGILKTDLILNDCECSFKLNTKSIASRFFPKS